MIKNQLFLIILFSGITLDLLTKNIAKIFLHDRVDLVGNLFYLEYFENPGIAFSMKVHLFFLKAITIILIIGIFYYYKGERKTLSGSGSKKQKMLDIGFGLILAGAIGNGIERVFNSKVIDFLGVNGFSVFNLADSFITIGAIIYLYFLYKTRKK